MGTKGFQRGFVHSRFMDLAFLLVMILIGWGIWAWLSTIVNGDFATAVALILLMSTGAAWWWTKDHRLLLRVPVGILVYLVHLAVLAPIALWFGSKFAMVVAAGLAAYRAKEIGGGFSEAIQARIQDGIARGQPTPWSLDQSINLIDDLARWLAGSILGWFLAIVPPMLLVFALPPESIPWAALIWAFAATTFYIYKYRAVRWRLFKLPLGLYAFVIVAVLVKLFQKQLLGPVEAGSFPEIAYVAYWPVVAALFMEFVVVGTHKTTA